MCGIAGYLHGGGTETARSIAGRMADCLAHRGPDGSAVWCEGEVALAHRRLAIVDLSPTGDQPMLSRSGRYVIVLNGEIYNHEELRTELRRTGSSFRGSSDTEVLLELIEQRGALRAIETAVGMFAFALWDREDHTLTLARDRLGEKPLYYGWSGGVFVFASELKALRGHPAFHGRVDPNAVAQLLRWGYIAAPASIFTGIHKLRAGELLELQVQPGEAPLQSRCRSISHRYWRVDEQVAAGLRQPFRGDLDDAADALDEKLSTAVRQQLRADVPVGAFLSGGIDSSLVVALMQRAAAHTVRTFSIGFEEPEFDESGAARRIAEHLRTSHTELRVPAHDARAVIPDLPRMFDEPFADSSQIPTYLLSRLTRQHVTVSLSGDGGDELFGGYHAYARGEKLLELPARRLLGRLIVASPQRQLARVAGGLPRTQRFVRRLERLAPMLTADYLELARRLSDNAHDLEELMPDATAEPPASDFEFPPDAPYGVIASLFDLGGYLPDGVLTKVDRASMRVSLESRAPLLDHRIAELAFSLPWSMRGDGANHKRVLRHLLYRYVPRELVDRPKQGFSIPLGTWLRGDLRAWAEDVFASRSAREDPFIDSAALQARWRSHRDGFDDRTVLLWAALMYFSWRAQWE